MVKQLLAVTGRGLIVEWRLAAPDRITAFCRAMFSQL